MDSIDHALFLCSPTALPSVRLAPLRAQTNNSRTGGALAVPPGVDSARRVRGRLRYPRARGGLRVPGRPAGRPPRHGPGLDGPDFPSGISVDFFGERACPKERRGTGRGRRRNEMSVLCFLLLVLGCVHTYVHNRYISAGFVGRRKNWA